MRSSTNQEKQPFFSILKDETPQKLAYKNENVKFYIKKDKPPQIIPQAGFDRPTTDTDKKNWMNTLDLFDEKEEVVVPDEMMDFMFNFAVNFIFSLTIPLFLYKL